MWTILMSNQMEKTIRDKKMIRAPPHMAKKKEGSVNDQADHGKYLKTLTKLFFFFFCGVQERWLIGILDSLISELEYTIVRTMSNNNCH